MKRDAVDRESGKDKPARSQFQLAEREKESTRFGTYVQRELNSCEKGESGNIVWV